MLYSKVNGIIQRFNDADEKTQDKLKILLIRYVENYAFLSFVVTYDDIKLEKLFVVAKFLKNGNLLRGIGFADPDLKGDLSLQYYRLEKTHEGDISLDEGQRPLKLTESSATVKTPDVMTTLSEIINAINEIFAGDVRVDDAESIIIKKWLEDLLKDPTIRLKAKQNSKDDFMKYFEDELKKKMLETEGHNELVAKIFQRGDLLKTIISLAGDPYYRMAKTDTLPPIRPCSPYENRLQFGTRISECQDFVNWIDLYLNKEGIEFLLQRKSKSVKEIKILTSLLNNESAIDENLHKFLVLVQKELEQKGITLEMRVITAKADLKEAPHDRFLIGSNIVNMVPSYTTMVAGRYSEFKKTENIPPFEKSWNASSSLDIIKDWDKIKEIRDVRRPMYPAKCSTCDKDFEVPFKPDGVRPVYCQEHMPQRR